MSKIQKALSKIRQTRSGAQFVQHDKSESDLGPAKADGANPKNVQIGQGDGGRTLEVSRDTLRQAGLIAPKTDEKAIAQQYQDIKRSLIALAFDKRAAKVERGNIIMITSALIMILIHSFLYPLIDTCKIHVI